MHLLLQQLIRRAPRWKAVSGNQVSSSTRKQLYEFKYYFKLNKNFITKLNYKTKFQVINEGFSIKNLFLCQ